MQRINLGKPYEDFIANMIESGYYGTATEVIRDALRDKMASAENNRIQQIHSLVLEGVKDFELGLSTPLEEMDWDQIMVEGRNKAKTGKPIPKHIAP